MSEAGALLAERINGIGGRIKTVPASILPQVQKEWFRRLDRLEKTDMYNKMLKDYFDFHWKQISNLVIVAFFSMLYRN